MIVYSRIVQAFTDVLTPALPGVLVERGRGRAVPEDTDRAVLIGLGLIQGQTYTVGGSIEWRCNVRLNIFSRSGDADAAALHAQVHEALKANPTLGIEQLMVDFAFSATDDVDDFDSDLAVVSVTYACQITTENDSGNLD